MIQVWDWHYRVYFDDELYALVAREISKLPAQEAIICEETLKFYTSFFSFGVLFNQCVENPEKCDAFLDKAEMHLDDIIRVPKLLIPLYYERVTQSKLYVRQKQRLLSILAEASCGCEIRMEYWSYIRDIFGAYAQKMFDEILPTKYLSSFATPTQNVIEGDLLSEFNRILSDVQYDKSLIERFGESAVGIYGLRLEDGEGYGEWWDKTLTGNSEDELVLFTQNSSVLDKDYFYTIVHEVYPGHGHFYNYVCTPETNIDQGAMLLIEDWATYCEWHSRPIGSSFPPSDYVSVNRHNAFALLRRSYMSSLDDLAERSWQASRAVKLPMSAAIRNLIRETQFVGYTESYYLGALWLEQMIDVQKCFTPKQFLDMLKRQDKGDYFRL